MVERIQGPGLPARTPARTAARGGGFRLPAGEAAAAASGVAGLSASGLLALQSPMTAAERDAAAARRGEALLRELDTLQHGLLSGRLRESALRRLAQLSAGEAGADPALRETLEALSLRARVELARHGRADVR